MLSRFLLILLPVLLPFALYFGYYFLTRGSRTEADGELTEEELPWMERGPWAWLFLSGVVLSGIAMAISFANTGPAPGDTIVRPSYKAPLIED
ncbi:hypothetical protein [Kiloniella antarctica]|uniref:Uncharacterized protein n=1 Tax=Kiloniella antarctica TaxID=1550907 RepID=A0ABW5BHN7_9PROT